MCFCSAFLLFSQIVLTNKVIRDEGALYLVPTKYNLQPPAIKSGLQVSAVPSEMLLCMGEETSCQVAPAVLGDAGHVRLMKKVGSPTSACLESVLSLCPLLFKARQI